MMTVTGAVSLWNFLSDHSGFGAVIAENNLPTELRYDDDNKGHEFIYNPFWSGPGAEVDDAAKFLRDWADLLDPPKGEQT